VPRRFNKQRLEQVLREHAPPAATLVQKVIDAVSRFSGVSRSDDVTVVALRGI
jgi:serine phosphatase RsbU (regulator of sigma subunit)